MYDEITPEERRKFSFQDVLLDKLGWLIFVLILGLLSSGLLMGVSYFVPVYGEGLDLEGKLLILKALDIEHDTQHIEEIFAENVEMEELENVILYWSQDGSVAFNFTGLGHQAQISGLACLNRDLKSMKGLVILEQQETPGLGGRIVEENFLNQFKGLAIEPEIVILPTGKNASKANEVDGITGATGTSSALEGMLRRGIREVLQRLEGRLDG